jgi:hypothetical protein
VTSVSWPNAFTRSANVGGTLCWLARNGKVQTMAFARGVAGSRGGSKASPPGYFLDVRSVAAGEVHGMDGVSASAVVGDFPGESRAVPTGSRNLDFQDGNTGVQMTGKTAKATSRKAITGKEPFATRCSAWLYWGTGGSAGCQGPYLFPSTCEGEFP